MINVVGILSVFSRVAEAAGTTVCLDEIIDHFEVGLDYRYDDELCDAVTDIDVKLSSPRFQQETNNCPW